MTRSDRSEHTFTASSHQLDDKHLMDYVRVVYKRRLIVFPIALIVLTIGVINTLRQVPVYQARTQLLIESDSQKTKIDQMFQADGSYFDDEFRQTQFRILQSRTLARRTIDAMKLWDRPRLGEGP